MLSKLARAALAMALVAAARPAQADAVDDFRNGTTILLRMVGANAGNGVRAGGGVAIGKAAGTLDFALAATDLGMPVAITMHLHGSSLGGGRVVYTVDDSYSPAVDIGGGHSLTQITGTLVANVARLPGTATPQIGDVRLLIRPSSYLYATGDWGTQTIAITNADLIGGIPQPSLSALVENGDYLVCSDSVETTQPLAVWLADVAQTGGAAVDLKGPFHGGVALPRSVVVPPGKRSVVATARIAPNFVGTVHLTAAATGVTQALDLTVHAHADCAHGSFTGPALQSWVASAVAGCTSCTGFLDVNHDDEKLTTINGATAVVRGRQVIDLLRTFPNATAVGAAAMNNDGTIAGRLTIDGVSQAYRANLNHGTPTPFLLGAMTPKAINNYDGVVGFRVVGGANQAVYTNGHGIMPLALTTSYGVTASTALDITDGGQVIGTYTDSAGIVRGFRWVGGATTTLPVLGAKPVIPVAVNEAGQIAVNGASGSGQPLAAIVSPLGTLSALGVPSGFGTFEVKSINRFGAVVGVATTTGTPAVQRAFAWTPDRGFIALTGYVANLIATDALRITDANEVVVRGTYSGAADLYLLTL
jgi:hypothetical protein